MERTILVIDDEKRLAESLAALLREEGYRVDSAVGGPDGIEKLKTNTYRLVITDLRMPEIDGFQIMDYIASNLPDTAMIVITGHASTQSAIEAIHQRVADYLTKPFEFDYLIASIEKVFAQIEREELRQDMMRMISHDIKVPLNCIMGFAQFIVDRETGEISPQAPDFVEKIVLNSQRILGLLDNYLTHARAAAGKLEIVSQPVVVQETISEAAGLMEAEFHRKGIALEVEIDDQIHPFDCDEHLLSRAVSNLISNAAKYTPEYGEVWIRLKKEEHPKAGEVVVIEVENSGPGIAPEDVPTVFAKYRRTSSAKGTAGSGLGLYVVEQVARAHGGWAECQSVENDLTTFRIVLPMKREIETKEVTA